MRDQVIPDDGLDVPALAVGKTLRRCGRHAAQSEREEGGGEQTERRHWQIPLVKSGIPNNGGRLDLFLVALRRLGGDDVVGPDPSGRADGETGLRTRGEFACGLV